MNSSSLEVSDNGITTLTDLLIWRSQSQPERVTYTFEAGDAVTATLTNRELAARSHAVAAELQMLNAAGERVLLLLPPGLDYIVAFLGCLCAGAIAVPAYPPHPNRSASRLHAIVKDAQPSAVLTTSRFLEALDLSKSGLSELKNLAWIASDKIGSNLASQWQPPSIESHALAFLQYTSGSTAAPKGVMVSHHNLLHNLGLISQHFEASAQSQGVIWLPPYHDMGLIGGILQPLYAGFPVTLMPPVNFLQQPIRWLRAISQYQASISGGPNFAYELCLSRISPDVRETLDLSSWDIAFTGAETIRAETLDRFADMFEPCGFRREAFYPCYGMAEATLFISGGEKNSSPIYQTVGNEALRLKQVIAVDRQAHDSSTLVGCGQTDPSQTIVIADPETCCRCDQNQVGEIWVGGSSIAQGYWHQPEKTQESFHAYLADTQAGPFLRTGDLGFLQDGELFVTGRLKDLIIIRGRNHYPQDIELTVECSHPALRSGCGAAFAVDVDAEERLVVVQEVERRHLRDLNVEAVAHDIRRAIAQHHDLQVYAILFLRTGSIPKTSSGKIQRYACQLGFQNRTLNVVGDWLEDSAHTSAHTTTVGQTGVNVSGQPTAGTGVTDTAFHEDSEERGAQNSSSGAAGRTTPTTALTKASTITKWLIVRLAQRLKVAATEINVHEPFSSYGLDSAAAVSLSGELENWLGRSLSPTLVYDYPSIAQLSQYLATETVATETISHISKAKVVPGNGNQEAIAVVGMECRFPGAESLDAFWQLLQDGREAITAVPGDRWRHAGTVVAGDQGADTLAASMGGFLAAVDQFDAEFFGIAPREAIKMDPQQRWLLEVAWAALENAGQSPTELAGSLTGVFIGTSSSDYGRLLDNTQLDAYVGTGNAPSIVANRLSYCFHLQGPSLAVDTACSSSLVAVHLACQSLRQGECNLALVGGVNALLTPDLSVAFAEAQMLAPDGRCKTFDAAADGYGRSEGCGVVVLKRLTDAEQAGDRILAVIHGSAINQDGRSNGLTAPNGPAQQAVIRQALVNANVAPAAIQYVEAHGTGTPLGDPIEVASLQAVLGQDRAIAQRCGIGSVKTNIGHLESAAGIAGLIKVVLALHHQQIPPHLHLSQLNPQVTLEGTPFFVPTQSAAWPDTQSAHFAGVSSFGFGGTNAHVVLGSIGRDTRSKSGLSVLGLERPDHLLTLSAKTESALRQLAEHYGRLATTSSADLSDICFSANTGRAHFSQRLAIVASSKAALAEQLIALSNEATIPGLTLLQPDQLDPPKVAFLFTGQGSQYVDMGWQLYETQPTFRAVLEQCDAILQPYLERSLLSLLYPTQRSNESGLDESSLIHQTAYTQPALFALEYALAQLWLSWGIEPDVVMGHSVGEYVAACIAGVFSLEDGLKLIAHRGRLMQSLPSGGAMAVVKADVEQVSVLLESANSAVAVAAINGPQNVVLSGEVEQIDQIVQQLTEMGIKTTRLEVSHGFHSPLVEPILEPFRQIAATIDFTIPGIPAISNLTGQLATAEIATPDYWVNHVRQPVQFSQGMATLQQQQCEILIEAGPKPVLLGMGHHCLPQQVSAAMQWLPSLRTGREDWSVLLESLVELYRTGIEIDWRGFDRDYQRQQVVLPTYPFQRQRYWIKPTRVHALQGEAVHPLLGVEQRLAASSEQRFEQVLSMDAPAWLADHRVFDQVIFPGAAFVELMLAASNGTVKDLLITRPLALEHPAILQTVVAENGKIELFAQLEGEATWMQQVTAFGDDAIAAVEAVPVPLNLSDLSARCPQHIELDAFYESLAMLGLVYGPQFRTLCQLQVGRGEFLARVEAFSGVEDISRYSLPPMLLDGAFQAIATLQHNSTSGDPTAYPTNGDSTNGDPINGDADFVYLPTSLDSVQVYQALGSSALVYGRGHIDHEVCVADLTFCNEQGQVLASVQGLRCRRINRLALRQMLHSNRDVNKLLYATRWQQISQAFNHKAAPPSEVGKWLVLGQGTMVGHLTNSLAAQGQTVQYIKPQAINDFLDSLPATDGDAGVNDTEALIGMVVVCDAAAGDTDQQVEAEVAASLQVIQALLAHKQRLPRGLTILTQNGVAIDAAEDVNPAQAALWGLGRTVQAEQPQLKLRLIDVETIDVETIDVETIDVETIDVETIDVEAVISLKVAQLSDTLLSDGEPQLALRTLQCFVPRLLPIHQSGQLTMPVAGGARLAIAQRGSLDNLKLESKDCPLPSAGEVQVAVQAAGLNFRDVLNTLGAYPGDPGSLGGELAGVVTAVGPDVTDFGVGDRVFGIAPGCFATHCNTLAALLVKLPASIDFAAAATVPVAFSTAQAAFDLLELKSGDKVLIHAAAGGVGLAAIQLAQAIGAEIYATASTPKQNYLRQLGIKHIYNSRTTDFGEQILRDTNGTGVNAVLNSLTSEGFIEASLAALATDGRFVEIGKRDIWSLEQMAQARLDVSYHILAIDDWSETAPEKVQRLLQEIAQRLASGELKPLNRRIYPITDVSTAMRCMQQAKHIGKIVLAVSHTAIRPEVSYLITGGCGALGLKACLWLIENGAKHVVLTSRRVPPEALQQRLSAIEAEYECRIVVSTTDVTDAEQVDDLIQQFGRHWPDLAGIVHAAGVLDDGTILEQTLERFTTVMAPKVVGALNLHRATQAIQPDFFVMYSSVAAALGSVGQSNYAAANAFLDGLAQHRRAQGLVATSINWGPWADAGMATSAVAQTNLVRQGLTPLQPSDAHSALAQMLASGQASGVVLDADWSRMGRWLGVAQPPILSKLLVAPVYQGDSALLQQLRAVTDTERQALLNRHLQQELQHILQLAQPPDADVGFFDLGMDSLMAVELYNRLQQQIGEAYTLPNTIAFDYPTIRQLATHLAAQLGALPQVATTSNRSTQLSASQRSDTDAVAIIGLACRFPGAADKDAYWQLLHDQIDAISEVPRERWDIDAYYDPDPEAPGKMTTRYGGFIEGIDQFDPAFFGITPREAVELDPQQRLLLEMSWQALEDANIAPATLVGSRTGVYVGISTSDYGQLITRTGEAGIGQYMGTGTAHSAAVGRISYVLGLEGPSLAIDTACSSSLVAVHQARRGLLNGECDLALVGGVNAMLTPEATIYFSRGRFMAADGRCKTFDAAADGYVRGEGCGVVLLKRLSDAERDGDRIYGVIQGSAINQDGASGGLTVPKGPSQQRVIEAALAEAQMQPSAVSYVEAHGTGTSLGDPVEIQALQTVLGTAHSPDTPLLVGSVKTNIGHLEAAAGIASIIKVALSLQQDNIPGQLHFQNPSPRISWDSINIKVVGEAQPWPDEHKVAGISGFAFQGTNAHVILAGYPSHSEPAVVEESPEHPVFERPLHLLPLSGKQEQAVRDLARSYLSWLQEHPDVNLADVCHTASVRRNHCDYRAGLVAEMPEQLYTSLEQLATGQRSIDGHLKSPQVAFLFTGQGSQYLGMGRVLYDTQPTFRQTLTQCAEILATYLDRPLLEVLYGQGSNGQDSNGQDSNDSLNQTAYTQPALFALGYSLARLWQSWGIRPSIVMGHSVGEYVAACIAGVFSLEDGLKLIAHRGRLMQQLSSGGAMTSLMAPVEQVRAVLADHPQVSIAAINGANSTVISGSEAAVQAVVARLPGIKSRELQVSHAFHSPQMQPMLAEFRQVASQVNYAAPKLKLISNITGDVVDETVATPDYWCQHVLAPVNFAAGMKTLHGLDCRAFLECGPKPILLGMGRECLPDAKLTWVPSLRPEWNDWRQMLVSLRDLYQQGNTVDWVGFEQDYPKRQRVDLPPYPFQRQRYWLQHDQQKVQEQKVQVISSLQSTHTDLHPLLGQRLESPAHRPQDYLWQVNPHAERLSYLEEHRVWQMPTFSLGTYIEMALASAQSAWGEGSYQLQNLTLHQPLFLPHSGLPHSDLPHSGLPHAEIGDRPQPHPQPRPQPHSQVAVQITLSERSDRSGQFQVHSRRATEGSRSPWILHATAELKTKTVPKSNPRPTVSS